jgi:hypothetical protein
MVEQAFVDHADLFDIEGAKGEAAGLALIADLDLEKLERFE